MESFDLDSLAEFTAPSTVDRVDSSTDGVAFALAGDGADDDATSSSPYKVEPAKLIDCPVRLPSTFAQMILTSSAISVLAGLLLSIQVPLMASGGPSPSFELWIRPRTWFRLLLGFRLFVSTFLCTSLALIFTRIVARRYIHFRLLQYGYIVMWRRRKLSCHALIFMLIGSLLLGLLVTVTSNDPLSNSQVLVVQLCVAALFFYREYFRYHKRHYFPFNSLFRHRDLSLAWLQQAKILTEAQLMDAIRYVLEKKKKKQRGETAEYWHCPFSVLGPLAEAGVRPTKKPWTTFDLAEWDYLAKPAHFKAPVDRKTCWRLVTLQLLLSFVPGALMFMLLLFPIADGPTID
eukprot:PLAT3316.5.p2 GENE.PLAT3316.5~~PLAT3316.5.p2  ORF type:complete len:347 (+),score=92.77 PLAT3316.5:2242-3282(+)